ncbi:hypothetical protein POF50_013000 [Streptomyces sp. SL13]|uniref:Cell division protein FtsL n=2 Tax=Streptantibioticus silvisoli TaxID=2705255 RepID=A0AA90H3V8_9ACTN|nr:hypothetical protein [Streptantibioticus silvisoli]MDI5970249.1 hypothetical protein [Streptantibioticus silvisoli]
MLSGGRDRRAARAPFVLLVVALLATGLISLLLLNASVNQGAFQLSKYKKQTQQYTDEEQALQQDVDRDSAPGELASKAHRLGMVPGGNPAFLRPNGTVRGVPGEAPAPPPPPPAAAPAPSLAPGSTALPTIDPSTQARTSGAGASPTTGR